MSSHISRSAFLGLAIIVVGTACTTANPQPTAPPSSDPDEVADPDTPTGGPIIPAEASDADRQAAVKAALATMNVWIQGSTLDEPTWRGEINATLTQGGQRSLETVWGYRVPDTALNGDPVIQREDLGTIVVRVPTDYTSYDLTVVSEQDQWLTAEIRTIDGQPV